MRRNGDVGLRTLERAHLGSPDDPAALGRYAAALGRTTSTAAQAARRIADLWAENEISDVTVADIDAVFEALSAPHGGTEAMAAANELSLTAERFDIEIEGREPDQDQRDPFWRRDRFHSIGFDFARLAQGGSLYAPGAASMVSVSEIKAGRSDGWLVVLSLPMAGASLENLGLNGQIALWVARSHRLHLSPWALAKTLEAAKALEQDLGILERRPIPDVTRAMMVICPEGNVSVQSAARGKGRRRSPLQDLVDGLLPGAKVDRGAGNNMRWQHPKSLVRLEVILTADHRQARERLLEYLRGRHQITPHPFRVRLEELKASYHEERGDESLTLTHVPTEETVAWWGGMDTYEGDDGELQETGTTVVGSLVEDGFLDPSDWTESAAHYADERGMVRVEDFHPRTVVELRMLQPAELAAAMGFALSDDVVTVARMLASSLFDSMAQPRNRGPAMTWGRLPEMAANRVRAELWTYLPEAPSQATIDAAAETARQAMIDLMGDRTDWET